MMPNCQVQILCKTSSAKIHQSENVRRGSCVEAPIAAQMSALHLVLIEKHVEGGYNGVGPHAQLLREVLLTHDYYIDIQRPDSVRVSASFSSSLDLNVPFFSECSFIMTKNTGTRTRT